VGAGGAVGILGADGEGGVRTAGEVDLIGPLRMHDIILELFKLLQKDAGNGGRVQRCQRGGGHGKQVTGK
jgi:hypothetical protein